MVEEVVVVATPLGQKTKHTPFNDWSEEAVVQEGEGWPSPPPLLPSPTWLAPYTLI